MADTYDLTLRLRADEAHSSDELIEDTYNPVLHGGILIYTLPNGKTIYRSLISQGGILFVLQSLSQTDPTAAQLSGDYRDVDVAYYDFTGGLDNKAAAHPNVKFDVLITATGGQSITMNGALSIEVEDGTIRIKPSSPAGTYHLFCMHDSVSSVSITPQVT